ncbi:MAG: DUF1194 domain-containing protein [Silicimonas sp.]|nr:DUF1194 domain-containing protein [Silicimonas sp.]
MRWLALALVAFAWVPAPALACRLALLLAMDVSSSIDEREYLLQRHGLAAALLAPEVQEAFLRDRDPVALSVFEWSGQRNQRMVIDWIMIRTTADLQVAAQRLSTPQRAERLFPTSLGSALGYAAGQLERAPRCSRKTLDVSGDGKNNDGFPPASAYRHFPFQRVVVNALAIGGAQDLQDLVGYFAAEVIKGPGAFVETAFDHDDFERAMRRKLERELRPLAVGNAPVSEPTHAALEPLQ